MEFRTLNANEIDVRIGTVSKTGASLLLYKDARCDMAVLDEAVGALNWQRSHARDNANCVVSIWDEKKERWISKEDTGTESNTEKEKGLASDSFKRACVNWGIGRELYTAPRIFIKCATRPKATGRGYELSDMYQFYGCHVGEIGYDESRNVNRLIILDQNENPIFTYGIRPKAPEKPTKKDLVAEITMIAEKKGKSLEEVCGIAGVNNLEELDMQRLKNCKRWIEEQ